MNSGSSSGSQLRCSIRWCRTKEEEKEPAEQRSSAHAIVSSTNSKAQAPNLNDAREAFPTRRAAAAEAGRREERRAEAAEAGKGQEEKGCNEMLLFEGGYRQVVA